MSRPTPPRWLERIVGWALPGGLAGQGALGDLAEEFQRRAATSPLLARLWYARQATSIVVYRVFTGSGADSAALNSDLATDLRWAARITLRHPGFALGVVAVLGLGLGANASVFSVVDGTFRNTSWWADADRAVAIWPEREISFGMLDLYEDEQAAYRTVGGYTELAFALRTPDGQSQSVTGVLITPALFREMAVQPTLGRALSDDDALLGVEPVVVLGEALWRRSFGADPGVVGSTVDVENATWTNTIGDPELITVWKDPDFDPKQRAFYYTRVMEIPTPRWTAYDAKRFGVKPLTGATMTLQERAYTSPIWYTP